MRMLFTDLDGTLLDHRTYRPGPAAPVLRRLAAEGVQVVFASSKTRSEQEWLSAQIGVEPILIVENGGAIHHGPDIVEFGTGREAIRRAVHDVADRIGVPAPGFEDLPLAEVAERTGLRGAALARALRREWSETLVLDHHDAKRLAPDLERHGIRLSRGGRFWTAHGNHDKATAVRAVIERMRPDATAGVGDAPNDAGMLKTVGWAAQVERPAGGWHPIDVPGLIRICDPGPIGFVSAIERLGW